MKIGLGPLADRISAAALDASRGKKGPAETRRRLAAAVMPMIEEAALAGFEQAQIAVAGITAAELALAERKAELRGDTIS
jgi:hypothetical protein